MELRILGNHRGDETSGKLGTQNPENEETKLPVVNLTMTDSLHVLHEQKSGSSTRKKKKKRRKRK